MKQVSANKCVKF